MKGRKHGWLVPLLAAALALCLGGAVYAGTNGGHAVLTIGVYAGSYWGTPNGDCYQVLDNAIARFEAEHPGVKAEYVSGISTSSYSEWLAQQILKGTEPDLYFVLPEDFDLLVSSGALERLDGYMAADPSFDPSAYYEPCLHTGASGGAQYALPYESVPTMMFVNRTLLEDNGIEMPDNDWTWEDFYRICARVTDVESRRFGVYDYSWVNALYANGAALFSEDGGACFLTDGKVRDAILFVKQLHELTGGYTVTAQDFDLGRVAFRPFLFSEYRAYQPYPWRVKKYSGFEWDCVCMPAGPQGGNISQLDTMLLGLSARGSRKELAWELLKLLSCDEAIQTELYAYSHGISPLRGVAESDEMLSQLHETIPGSVSFDREAIRDIMSTAAPVPKFSGCEQAMTMAQSAVAQVMNDEETLTSRLLSAQREINIYLGKS